MEYWMEQTLFEIAGAIGTPLVIDAATKNRTFGHFARVMVDMDLFKRIFDEVLDEREGYAFKVEVVYERMSLFCSHCRIIGHNVSNYIWFHPTRDDQLGGTKQPKHEAPKKSTQHAGSYWYLCSWC